MPRIFFASKRKNETNLSPFGQPRKKRKKKEKEGDVGEGCGRHFSACFSNLVFTYKNKETPLERKAFSGRKTEYRT